MAEQSTILLEKRVISLLKKAREYPRQTYNELLEEMANIFIKMKEKNQPFGLSSFQTRNQNFPQIFLRFFLNDIKRKRPRSF